MNKRSSKRLQRTSRPAIEGLESRALMSGSVQTFAIDAAQSIVSMSVLAQEPGSHVADYTATPQRPGSLTTHVSGTLSIASTASSIKLTDSSLKLANNGNASPGNTPANFAGTFKNVYSPKLGKVVTYTFAGRNMVMKLTSGLMSPVKGKFNGKTGTLLATGTLEGIQGPRTVQRVGDLTSTTKATITTTVSGSLTVDSKGDETLKIDISTTATTKTSMPISVTFSEQLVATSHL